MADELMRFTISDNMISAFASGLFVIFALIAVGAVLMLILSGLARKFPFTRVALTLALTPLSLIQFIDGGTTSTLYLYAMITLLLGITIDGIAHILTPKAPARAATKKRKRFKREEPVEEDSADDEEGSGVIVWEKAE